jgi:hypothetical protein
MTPPRATRDRCSAAFSWVRPPVRPGRCPGRWMARRPRRRGPDLHDHVARRRAGPDRRQGFAEISRNNLSALAASRNTAAATATRSGLTFRCQNLSARSLPSAKSWPSSRVTAQGSSRPGPACLARMSATVMCRPVVEAERAVPETDHQHADGSIWAAAASGRSRHSGVRRSTCGPSPSTARAL